MTSQPLHGIVVSVVTGDPSAAICTRHLERLGATIVAGAQDEADIVLDGDGVERELTLAPAGTLVCVFESHRLRSGGLVASETTAQAAIALTDYIAAPGASPARTGCDIGTSVAGFCAVQAVLAWLYGGRVAGTRQEVRVSTLRALSTLKTILWAARSRPDSWTGTHVRSRNRLVDSGYRTRGRRITLDFPVGAEESWLGFVQDLGLGAATIERLRPRWHESIGWGDDVDLARPLYEERLGALGVEDAVALVRRNGGSSVPFQTPAECLAHPQSDALGLGESLERGLPWRLEARRARRVASRGTGDPSHPLAGVRVVDFGVGGVGPFAATLLGWLGANVVKIEAPNEFILAVRPTVDGLSTTYLALNQGKRSVSLNLKHAGDHALALGLVAEADVVLENFRPGALERLGLGYEHVAVLNPDIVYCSATGFGWAGPLRDEPCTDPHMQAFSGFAALNADQADGVPRRIRYYGFVDLVTSTIIVEAVCAALVTRAAEGGPVHVETSMLHAVIEAQQGATQAGSFEPDGIFRALDGYVALTCRTDAEWRALVDALPSDELRDSRGLDTLTGRIDQRDRVQEALGAIFEAQPAAAWEHALGRCGIPCVRVLRDDEILGRKEYWDEGLLRDLPLPHGSPLVAGGPPWRLGVQISTPLAPVPGAHTGELRADPAAFWQNRPAKIEG